MSRRDKIIALAISKTVHNSSQTANSKNDVNHVPGIESPVIQREPVVTDINNLWSRSYDYNDFKPIFDFQNEYSNSSQIVQTFDFSTFMDEALEKAQPMPATRFSLKCYESLPLSDEDDWTNNKTADNFFGDSDDSVKDKDYSPDSTIGSDSDSINTITSTVITTAEIHKEISEVHEETLGATETIQLRNETIDISTVNQHVDTNAIVDGCLDEARPVIELEEEASVNEKGFTKSGLPRKRKSFDTPASERLKRKKENYDEKLALKPPCTEKCRKNCTAKFTEEDRQNIHDRYLKLNWEARGLFIKGMVEPGNVKKRTKENVENIKKRNISYTYNFMLKNEKIVVCKTFFLTTLGYNSQNNTHIHMALSKEIDDQKDKRGCYERKNVIDKNKIREHIEKYEPTSAHYRREHASLRLYIASDVTITMMHRSFMEEYPDMKVSFETYRQVLKNMNISFSNLGHEECEQCALFKLHTGCSQDDCETCLENTKHTSRYTESRKKYKKDKEQATTDKENIYFSMDLQKVIMLPRMEQFKSAIFCPRIIAFNESFVPLGKTSDTSVPYAVVWNETISGRSQEDIISALRSFLTHKRDAKNIVLWADNCAAQNKNWAFMSFLVNIINSELISAESITVKYFEPGHTYMSADHFHHQVEKSLTKKKKVYDFEDFVDAVKMSNSNKNTVKVMTISDFYCYEDFSSQHKIRNKEPRVYLKHMMVVRADRGSFTLRYKEMHDDLDWKELDFLQVKIKKKLCFPIVGNKTSLRGISKERKQRIIADLVPLMPLTRREFWLNLPEFSLVPNLD